jgi:hypothetical protein
MWPNLNTSRFSPAALDSIWGVMQPASAASPLMNSTGTHKARSTRILHRFGEAPPRLYRDSMLDLTPDRIMNDLGIVPGD